MPNRPWSGTARNSTGDAVASPTVTVYLAGTLTLASIFDSAGVAKVNPFAGAADGTFEFYVDDAVKVDVLVEATGFISRTFSDLPTAITDFGDLTGTSGDPLTQYALLAGRVGGQTVLQGLTVEDGLVVNDLGDDHDTRIEGATDENLLFVNAGADRVGVGTNDPQEKLHVASGSIRVGGHVFGERVGATLDALVTALRNATFIIDSDNDSTNASFLVARDGNPNTIIFQIREDNNFAFGAAGSFGSGVGVVFLANRTTAPTTNPTGGGILYVEAGSLKFRGSSGTVTILAPA